MERPQLKADYIEKIEIQPEDVIPKSNLFKFVKYSLVSTLILMKIIAIIAIIVAESYLEQTYLAVGLVSLVGIILFLIGLIAIMKEHVPSILIFAVSMIFYLLIIMYSRIFDTAGWIIFRTIVLALIIVGAIVFCILIREWHQIQVSRLRQRAIKEAQLAQYGLTSGPISHYQTVHHNRHHNNGLMNAPINPYIHNHQYEQIENPYSQIGPGTSGITLTTTHYN